MADFGLLRGTEQTTRIIPHGEGFAVLYSWLGHRKSLSERRRPVLEMFLYRVTMRKPREIEQKRLAVRNKQAASKVAGRDPISEKSAMRVFGTNGIFSVTVSANAWTTLAAPTNIGLLIASDSVIVSPKASGDANDAVAIMLTVPPCNRLKVNATLIVA